VIGASFLHHGYRETADAVVEAFRERIEFGEQGFVDHKTELQERLARQGSSVSYRLMTSSGPAHRRSFTSAAMLGDELLGLGEGPSKKASEQAAAQEALLRVDHEGKLCT
jgi:ribonuclease-3